MFSNDIITYEMYDELEFSDVYTFINKNDDEYYGFYKYMYSSEHSRQNVFLHIKRNSMKEILVNSNDNIKDYFGYTDEIKRNNIMLIESPYICLGLDKVNIDDSVLIPVNPDGICLYDQNKIVFRNKSNNFLWLSYKTDCYRWRDGNMFFFNRVKEGKTNYVYYTKDQFNLDFSPIFYTPYLLKDNIDVRFTIKCDR